MRYWVVVFSSYPMNTPGLPLLTSLSVLLALGNDLVSTGE